VLGTLVAACLTSGCRSVPLAPGEPSARLSPKWIQGDPTEVVFTWPNAMDCGVDDWGCAPPVPPLTVVQITCHSCDVIDDPTGITTPNWSVMTAVATADGPITIDATLRFDATGDERHVALSTTGDHEVALEAECKLIETSALSSRGAIPVELFHECGATHVAGETAVVFPRIRTAAGDARFPFCVGRPCTTYYGEELRPISSLMIAPSPTSWAYTTANDVNEFAVLPPVIPDQSVSVSAPLASGTISTVSVPIPAIE